jgi:AcrR family transcriptional regulator
VTEEPIVCAVTRRPGRPRDDSLDAEVIRAVLELLGEEGLGGFSMDAIAERAGVSKATIYRRWDSKEELIIDGVASLVSTVQPVENDDVRMVLITLLKRMRRFLFEAKGGTLFPSLVAEVAADSDIGRRYAETVIVPRRQMVAEVISNGIDRGELRPNLDVEVAVDMLIGPPILTRLIGRFGESSDDWEERFVDSLLRGWTP